MIAPHHHVIRAHLIPKHIQRMGAEGHRVVVELFQIHARELIDELPALGEVPKAVIHALHEPGNNAPGVADDPANVRQIAQHPGVAEPRRGQGRIAREAKDGTQHELLIGLGVRGQHGVDEDAEVPPVRLLKKGPVGRIGKRLAPDVAEQHHAVELQLIQGSLELLQRRIGIVHGDRGKALEARGIGGDEFRVGVVHHAGHGGLVLCFRKEHVRRGQGHHLHVDAHRVHGFEAKLGVRHGRGNAKEARALVLDDGAPRGIFPEGELPAPGPDLVEKHLGVVMRV